MKQFISLAIISLITVDASAATLSGDRLRSFLESDRSLAKCILTNPKNIAKISLGFQITELNMGEGEQISGYYVNPSSTNLSDKHGTSVEFTDCKK